MLLLLLTYWYGRERLPTWIATVVLMVEISVLNVWVALNGAATNPYSVFLLIPLVLGLVLLPQRFALLITVVSIAGQASQLYLPHMPGHSDMMMQHSRSMIIGFVVTCLILASVIFYFRLRLNEKTEAIQALREKQLRNEQLLAIGTAAAQLTHEAATPIQTLRLLLEEQKETKAAATDLSELDEQCLRLERMLKEWRSVADDVREARKTHYSADNMLKALRHSIALARPEAHLVWSLEKQNRTADLQADRTLLPALTSIIVNACEASEQDNEVVTVTFIAAELGWTIKVENAASRLNEREVESLGNQFVPSGKGSGVGSVLSNASIEKWGGKVSWHLHQGRIVTSIWLPFSESE